jgi:Shikimate kinase
MLKPNIVLIGMPGAGKSTVGVLLAKALGMAFIDTDIMIQEKQGCLLQELINGQGVAKFLSIEEQTILQLQTENCVIATGGSVIYSSAAIKHLKESGLLLYLNLRYDEIEQRINNMSSRGIVIEKGRTLLDLYQERVVLYEKQADIIVDCSDLSIEGVVAEILIINQRRDLS